MGTMRKEGGRTAENAEERRKRGDGKRNKTGNNRHPELVESTLDYVPELII
jgi:hypothetical protein